MPGPSITAGRPFASTGGRRLGQLVQQVPEGAMAVYPVPQAEVQHRTFGTTAEVEVSGELDIASTPGFERAVEDALRAGPERVMIDLREVTFIDSSGIHALLRVRRRATAQEIGFVVLRPV